MSTLTRVVIEPAREEVAAFDLRLSADELQLLAQLRFYHVQGNSLLYQALADLPWPVNDQLEDGITDMVVLKMHGQSYRAFDIAALEEKNRTQAGIIERQANIIRELEKKIEALKLPPAPVLAPPLPALSDSPVQKWKVQYRDSTSNRWYAHGNAPPSFASRNAAYRWMRDRIDSWKFSPEHYRVVSLDTKDGVDNGPRGHYLIQYWNSLHTSWRDCAINVGCAPGPNYYTTSGDAAASIKQYGIDGQSYRIKWVP